MMSRGICQSVGVSLRKGEHFPFRTKMVHTKNKAWVMLQFDENIDNILNVIGVGGLDLVAVGGVNPVLRGVFRRGSRLHSVDDYCRAVQPGSAACRHVHRRACQLVCQFLRRHRLPHHADNAGKLHLLAIQHVLGCILVFHL